jgi:hypothetical protein
LKVQRFKVLLALTQGYTMSLFTLAFAYCRFFP